MIVAALTALGVVIAGWAVLAVLAARLPPGLARDVVEFLPACLTMLRRLRRDPRVPMRVKVAFGFAAAWVVSPIDPIPDFLPVIGAIDEAVIVALALRYAARATPAAVLFEAWPGNPRTLARLLGSSADRPAPGPD